MNFHLSTAARQMLKHVAIVFFAAFGTALVAGAVSPLSIPTLLALLYSAAGAGVIAVVHYELGLVPKPLTGAAARLGHVAAVPLAIQNRLYQVVVSIVTTFLSIFGAALVAGTLHVPGASLPSLAAVVLAAISAGVTGVVQLVDGLVPAPAS